MQTLSLEIDDKFFPHFKVVLDSFIKDNKVAIIDKDDFDYENNYPESLVISSVEEVRARVYEAEQQKGLTEDEYNILMDKFFREELGIER